jgi:hypothetical protein
MMGETKIVIVIERRIRERNLEEFTPVRHLF